MTTQQIEIWHCDAATCGESVPAKTDGWFDGIYTHGCPAHADLISGHRGRMDCTERGRGYKKRNWWTLRCACGWKPPGDLAWGGDYFDLQKVHLAHVEEVTRAEEEGTRSL